MIPNESPDQGLLPNPKIPNPQIQFHKIFNEFLIGYLKKVKIFIGDWGLVMGDWGI